VSELTRRVLFSLVAIPVALGAIWYGDWALAALLAIAAALAAHEYFNIARAAGHEPFSGAGAALAGLIPIVLHARRLGLYSGDLATMAMVLLLIVFAASIWLRWPGGKPLGAAATTGFGVAYAGATLGYGYLLRYHPYAVGRTAGAALLALPLILTWTSDIGAYFVGRALGRRKLIPAVSPGKTWAGAVGALVCCMVVAWAYQRWVLVPQATLSLRPFVPALSASGALLFGASAVEDYLCLSRRSNGQACGVLPPALFYAGIGLALLLLVASVLLWLRTARAAGQQVGGSADD